MSDILYLAELVVYDPSIPGTTTLRYATRAFVTGPAETPASALYSALMSQPAFLRRTLFGGPTATKGRSEYGFGDLILENGDAQLDGLMAYGFDGRAVTIWQGLTGAAYPGGFTKVFVGTMEQAVFDAGTVTITVRDRQFSVGIPLQSTKYTGANALPAGLEGTAELTGRPKPVCLGKVFNAPLVPVNTSKLIYQAHDGALASVDNVYDRGVALGVTGWIAAGSVAGTMVSSGDGITFTKSPNAGIAANALCSGAGVVVGITGGNIYSSPDGTVWTLKAALGGAGIAYNGSSIYVACVGGLLKSSPDLVTWTTRVNAGANSFNEVKFYNAIFIACGDAGILYTSADGITWAAHSPGATTLRALAYTTAGWITAGDNGVLYSSTDNGTTWTARTSQFGTTPINNAAGGGGMFVIVGDSGKAASSPDMVTWTIRFLSVESTARLYGIDYGNGRFTLVGYESVSGTSGVVCTSPDGMTWTRAFGVSGDSLIAVTYISALTFADYANSTDLLDDTKAPAAGLVKTYLAGGYIRLGSPPAGLITADLTEGATAADRTTAQLWKRVLTRAGLVGADYSAADITALDAANAAVCGLWADAEVTCAEVCDRIAASPGAWWGIDAVGIFRIQQIVTPAGAAVVSYVASDLLAPPKRLRSSDPVGGLPVFKTLLRYARLYAVQDTDVAGSVTAARRAVLKQEWSTVSATDATVQTTHLLAPQTTEDTCFAVQADAQTEATRRQTLRGVRHDPFELVVPVNEQYTCPDLGNVIQLTHSRYALSGGKLGLVLGVDPDVRNRRATLTVWMNA